MPQSPSWIDPEAFLQSLGEPAAESWSTEAPEGSAAEAPIAGARPEPDRVSTPAPPAPRPTAPAVQPLSGLPIAAIDDLERRAGLFRSWMRTLVGERPFFVTDAEGQILVVERVSAERAVVGPVLERALRVLRPFVGGARARGAHVLLEDGQLLQMIWNRTERGRVAVGIFGDPVLDADRVEWVSRAVERVFEKEPRS
jgi:hypothetical protein